MGDVTFKQARAAAASGGDYALRRRLDPEMPSIDELVIALWERDVEGRPQAQAKIDELQARRARVKARHQK